MTTTLAIAIAARVALSVSCEAEIRTYVPADPDEVAYTQDGIVWIRTDLNAAQVKRSVLHECGHILFDDTGWRGPFGSPPYVNQYARTDRHEDFAESYAYYHMGWLPQGQKRMYIRRLRR
jgi:hypothetical protein